MIKDIIATGLETALIVLCVHRSTLFKIGKSVLAGKPCDRYVLFNCENFRRFYDFDGANSRDDAQSNIQQVWIGTGHTLHSLEYVNDIRVGSEMSMNRHEYRVAPRFRVVFLLIESSRESGAFIFLRSNQRI